MEFTVERNDIARMDTDVVVLPANWRLRMGTGVSMALFEAAGREELEAECAMKLDEAKRKGRKLAPGASIPTHAYALPSKIILHTVVPRWNGDDPRGSYENLCKAYSSALSTTDEMGCESVAFPVLAAGNNGFDIDLALDIAIDSLQDYAPKNKLSQAVLVTFGGDVTQRMRGRGFDVEEHIDQLHVLDQNAHQAKAVEEEGHFRRRERGRGQSWQPSEVDASIATGMNWFLDPDNLIPIFDFAAKIAREVLPDDGPWGVAKTVIDGIARVLPIIGGKS